MIHFKRHGYFLTGTHQVPSHEIFCGIFFLITVSTCSNKDSSAGHVSTFLGKAQAAFVQAVH